MYACNGILFNHESPRRGETFVTRKITRALAHILSGKQKTLFLGNLDAKRDWGFAAEYVMMMWLMLQQDAPDDYTVGTGDTHTVREFVNDTFSYAGIELEWEGAGAREKARVKSVVDRFAHTVKTPSVVVEILPRYFRPTEVDWLQADISKAKNKLQWEPKVGYRDLYRLMVDYDMLFEKLEAPMQGIEAINALGYNWIRQPLHNITGGMF
jgi:GDPmannose 4,6-dehydratase